MDGSMRALQGLDRSRLHYASQLWVGSESVGYSLTLSVACVGRSSRGRKLIVSMGVTKKQGERGACASLQLRDLFVKLVYAHASGACGMAGVGGGQRVHLGPAGSQFREWEI